MAERAASMQYACEAGLAWITPCRPEVRNALDEPALQGLGAALARAEADPVARVVVITGAGTTWRALHRGLDLPLEESTSLGAEAFEAAAETEDFREGTRAFLEKRPPAFRGT